MSYTVFIHPHNNLIAATKTLALILGLAFLVLPQQALAQAGSGYSTGGSSSPTPIMPGYPCTNLGATQMSADQSTIVACMLVTGNTSSTKVTDCTNGCVWKSSSISLVIGAIASAEAGSGNGYDSGEVVLGTSGSAPGNYILCALTYESSGPGWNNIDMEPNPTTCNVGIDTSNNWFIHANIGKTGGGQPPAGYLLCYASCFGVPAGTNTSGGRN